MQDYPQYPEAGTTIWRIDPTNRRYKNTTPKLIGSSVLLGFVTVLFMLIALFLLFRGIIPLPVFILLMVLIMVALFAAVFAMRGPMVSVQTIYTKQGAYLYRGIPVSKFSYMGQIALLLYILPAYFDILNITLDITVARVLGIVRLVAVILAIVFIFMGLNETKRVIAEVTDINSLINRPLAQVLLIDGVNKITEKAQYYKVNCTYMRVKPNGQYASQKKINMNISKDYPNVEMLMQAFSGLQTPPRA